MKVKVLQRWLLGGRPAEPGEVLELPGDLAQSGIRRGLCSKVKPRGHARKDKGSAGAAAKK